MRLIGLAVGLAIGLTLAPLAVEAQQVGRVYRVGLIVTTSPCQRAPHIEPPGSGKLSHPGSPIVSQAGSPILSHPGAAIGSHPVARGRIPSSFSPSPGILTGAHQLQEVTSGGTEESGDRHP
jgi:hypothetical protein